MPGGATFHMRMTASLPPTARRLPSGEKAIQRPDTGAHRHRGVLILQFERRPLLAPAMFHTFTVPPLHTVAKVSPSGVKAAPVTVPR